MEQGSREAFIRQEISRKHIPIFLLGRFHTREISRAIPGVDCFRGWTCYYDQREKTLRISTGVIVDCADPSGLHLRRLVSNKPVDSVSDSLARDRDDYEREQIASGLKLIDGTWLIQPQDGTLINYEALTEGQVLMLNALDADLHGFTSEPDRDSLGHRPTDPEILTRLSAANPNVSAWFF